MGKHSNAAAGTPLPARPARQPYLDVLRILSAFFVIVNHTSIVIFRNSVPSWGWLVSLAWYFVSKPAVPVFLMITGILFLDREPDWSQTRRRSLRILAVLAASNLFYYGYHLLTRPGMKLSLLSLANGLLDKEVDTLWYLDLYLGILLMMPFFQKLARSLSRREEAWLLFLSVGVLSALAMVPHFLPELRLSATFRTPLLPTYVGYLFLGHYIHRYWTELRPRRTLLLCGLLFTALLVLELWLSYGFYGRNPSSYLQMDNRLFLTVAIRSVCLFTAVLVLCRNLEQRPGLCRCLEKLAVLTFGIFLLGDLAIDLTKPLYLWMCGFLPRMGAMLLWELVIFALSGLWTWLLRRIPPLRRFL